MKEFNYNFWDQPYLQAAGAGFAGVFLAFHPFFKVDGLEQASGDWRATASLIKRSGHSISWARVIRGADLRDTRQLCQAYYSHFNRLKGPFMDRRASTRLVEFTTENDVEFPEEDQIPALHEVLIGRLYQRIGIETIVVGDDWHKEWKPVKVESLLDQEKSVVDGGDVPRPKCSYSGGHEIVTVSCVNDPYHHLPFARRNCCNGSIRPL